MILAKDKLRNWLDALNKYTLYAPTESDGIIRFTAIDDPKDISFERKVMRPPKEIMFPQTEVLFEYTLGKEKEIREPPLEKEKSIIFGIRPCDARSFSILDHVFKDEYEGVYYLNKRKNTVSIGMACSESDRNCFCTSLDGSPGSKDDVDILLTDIGDRYFVDVVTEEGKALVDESKELFTPASEDDGKKKEEIIENTKKSIMRTVDVNGISEKLGEIFESDFWMKESMKCLGCGICTYLCPTCHCFDIQDETRGEEGRRIRVWDTCANPEYTLHASGYNPRPGRMNRLRNKVYHKYKYYPDNHDVIACVGCGRCITLCPINSDIVDILTNIKEVEK